MKQKIAVALNKIKFTTIKQNTMDKDKLNISNGGEYKVYKEAQQTHKNVLKWRTSKGQQMGQGEGYPPRRQQQQGSQLKATNFTKEDTKLILGQFSK